MWFPLLVTLFLVVNSAKCAKILAAFPSPSISHQIVFQPIWKELSIRGHQVTVITPNPLNDSSLINLTEVDTSSTYKVLEKSSIVENMSHGNLIKVYLWMFATYVEIGREYFQKTQPILEHLANEFDLIIVEPHLTSVYSLKCKFEAPVIAVSSLGLFYQTHDAVGNPSHPFIAPDVVNNYMGEPTFYEKVTSTLQYLWYRIIFHWHGLPLYNKLAKEFWGECPYFTDFEKKIDLVFINSNPILHPVRANVPSVVEMKQLHINGRENLPEELQKYLDESPQGVVYFSFGTNVKGVQLSSKTREIIRDALSELPYNVLWKWENHSLPNKPDNVMIMKWFPQQDVLAHKNVKVFVTQGGLQSMEEAINNAVPMVGIPFIADQYANVKQMVSLGFGKALNHIAITKKDLKQSILEVAENQKYRKKVLQMRNVLSDGSVNGLEKSLWWIEYVLRRKGAKYLRSPAADLSWFDYYLADVAALFLFVLLIFTYFAVCCCRIFSC